VGTSSRVVRSSEGWDARGGGGPAKWAKNRTGVRRGAQAVVPRAWPATWKGENLTELVKKRGMGRFNLTAQGPRKRPPPWVDDGRGAQGGICRAKEGYTVGGRQGRENFGGFQGKTHQHDGRTSSTVLGAAEVGRPPRGRAKVGNTRGGKGWGAGQAAKAHRPWPGQTWKEPEPTR